MMQYKLGKIETPPNVLPKELNLQVETSSN